MNCVRSKKNNFALFSSINNSWKHENHDLKPKFWIEYSFKNKQVSNFLANGHEFIPIAWNGLRIENLSDLILQMLLGIIAFFIRIHFWTLNFKKNVIFQYCKNSKKNFDCGICMFDVAKCHLSLKTDFQLEFSKSIRDLSSLIAKEFSLLMFKIVVRVIYVRENFKCSKKYPARTWKCKLFNSWYKSAIYVNYKIELWVVIDHREQ